MLIVCPSDAGNLTFRAFTLGILGQYTMDKDRFAGSKDFAGKVEDTLGGIAGDAKTQAAGKVRDGPDH
jgi:hypothetical protein